MVAVAGDGWVCSGFWGRGRGCGGWRGGLRGRWVGKGIDERGIN